MNAHHERATELLDANFNGPSYMFHADGDDYGNVDAAIRERLGL